MQVKFFLSVESPSFSDLVHSGSLFVTSSIFTLNRYFMKLLLKEEPFCIVNGVGNLHMC